MIRGLALSGNEELNLSKVLYYVLIDPSSSEGAATSSRVVKRSDSMFYLALDEGTTVGW